MNKSSPSLHQAPADLPATDLPRLALDEVSCAFGPVLAVDRLSLDIMPGEFVSLLGPSGCGKTTTLRMIAGFINPTAGSIAMDGSVISSPGSSLPPERRQMSMIFQSYAIWPNMTVAENVAFGLQLRRLDRATIRRKVMEMLDTVQLAALAERYPAELSGGQQQRVALARAMVIQPRVLLLDEPLSNLDANLREEMRFEIRRLHDTFHFTTVYVTHDQGEAMVTSDRIAVSSITGRARASSPASSGGPISSTAPARARRSCSIGSPCRAAASRMAGAASAAPSSSRCARRASCSIANRRRPRRAAASLPARSSSALISASPGITSSRRRRARSASRWRPHRSTSSQSARRSGSNSTRVRWRRSRREARNECP